MYIYNLKNWPDFLWDSQKLIGALGEVRNLQGKIVGSMESLGFELKNEAVLNTLTLDVLKSTEIEGEIFKQDQVRSSLARRLGIETAGMVHSSRDVDGVVEMMFDATNNFRDRLTTDRLFGWHCALFPTGRSGMRKIMVGDWRHGATGPMQVVSGAVGKEKIHFEAPEPSRIPMEMTQFLKWFNGPCTTDIVLKAGLAHLWFVTIHPFEDGNGRIARALTDMLLARADGISQRYYSMSSQILKERKGYYHQLETTQKGGLDVTNWMIWFVNCLYNSLKSSEETLANVMFKYRFWQENTSKIINDRQRLMLNKLLEGFKGKLTSTKWAKITKCSGDSALRDIQDLIKKGILEKEPAGGRSTGYTLRNKKN